MDEMTRRRFLVRGVEAFAFCAAADAAKAATPSYRVRVALVGVGKRGKQLMAKAAKIPGFEIAVTCDKTDDWRRVLDDKSVDAVVCTAPDHLHASVAMDALRAGKAVYVEPPVALTLAEAEAVAKTVRETKGVYAFGDRYACSTVFPLAVAAARAGVIGEVRRGKVWDLNALPPCDAPDGWKRRKGSGAGTFAERGFVFAGLARQALNVPEEPEKVMAAFQDPAAGELPETGTAVLRFAGNRALTVELSGDTATLPYLDMSVGSAVYGEKGAIVFAPNDRAMMFDNASKMTKVWEGREPEAAAFAGALEVPSRDLDLRTLATFAAAIRDPEIRPTATIEDGLSAMRLTALLEQA